MTVLDLCCGDGYFTAPLAKLVLGKVIALDIDCRMLVHAVNFGCRSRPDDVPRRFGCAPYSRPGRRSKRVVGEVSHKATSAGALPKNREERVNPKGDLVRLRASGTQKT